jgi:hypothetical protein
VVRWAGRGVTASSKNACVDRHGGEPRSG